MLVVYVFGSVDGHIARTADLVDEYHFRSLEGIAKAPDRYCDRAFYRHSKGEPIRISINPEPQEKEDTPR